jgi:Uma2 family endonuclease
MVETADFPSLYPTLPIDGVTFEEFLVWSLQQEHGKSEYVCGKIYFDMGTTAKHSRIIEFLMGLMRLYLEVKGMSGDILGPEFIMRLTDNVEEKTWCEPDILYVSKNKLSKVHSAYLSGAADLVVEVISQESKNRDYTLKYAEYESAGIKEYWIIDPLEDKTIFYRLNSNSKYQEILLDTEGFFISEVIGGLAVSPEWFRQDPLPPRLPIVASW